MLIPTQVKFLGLFHENDKSKRLYGRPHQHLKTAKFAAKSIHPNGITATSGFACEPKVNLHKLRQNRKTL